MNGDRHVGESGNHEKTTSTATNVSITMSSDRNSSSTTRRRRGWKMDGEGTDVRGRHGHEGRMREVMIYNAGTTYQSVRTPTVLVHHRWSESECMPYANAHARGVIADAQKNAIAACNECGGERTDM